MLGFRIIVISIYFNVTRLKLIPHGKGDRPNISFSCISIFQAAARGQAEQEELAKKMEVCETCGSLLVANDTQQRVDEHLMGKQHMGYARIRAFIEERKVG